MRSLEPKLRPLIGPEQIRQRIRELAQEIRRDYAQQYPVLVGVLKGAFVFLADLVRELRIPVECDFVKISSYGKNTETSGQITLQLDTTIPLAGRHVLVVEDIVDTGLTTAWLIEHLKKKTPASLRVCALLDKPARRRLEVPIDYVGFRIPDRFVVGYGIDCAEAFRELDYIGYVAQEETAP
ncbi:MAG: hypoxanthine phosphoribosyltransferase [Gemmatales bacterium]|nr:hypoxanthine phosphoribosyltransferase [Gemmatales bacterium]MDW8222144.1 hypoxanthine phosphoribosyltransferase [Gemmatales bacterium]